MKKKYLFLTLVLVVVAFTSLFFWKKSGTEIVHPKRGDITEAVYALGKVKSHKQFEVIVGVISVVEKLLVEEGDLVKKGSSLIQLQAGANVKTPFTGTVTLVRPKEGETVLPSIPIIRVEDLDDRYIELSLEQEAALRMRQGLTAKVSFESLRGKVLEGKVYALFPREDEFLAHIEVPGLEPNVLPGMTADVSVEIGTIKNALLVPLKAVSNGMITVKRKGRWVKEQVEVGHVDGIYVEIRGNKLKETDEIRVEKGG